MAIDIPVSANFNDGEIKSQISQINAQVKSLGAAVAQANKQKFEPISLRSKEDLKSFVQQTQQLLKVQTELRRRMKETGQAGMMPLAADWKKLYPNVQQRNAKLQEVLGFYGNDFENAPTGGRSGGRLPPRPSHRPPPSADTTQGARGGSFWGGVAARGFGGAGALGSTAGGAINAGLSGGGMGGAMRFGLAGLLAFGASKAIGGVVNKVGSAEDNEIAYDTLKRTLGDVNVAFKQLKSVVKMGSEAGGVTYAEGARLSTMYAKAGNLSGSDFRGMGGEVGTGIGMSRSYGLDPSQGVGMLGMMRGLGITRSANDTRRFALLIGETIGKSKSFAKAGEMMEVVSGYAAMQARTSLTNSVSGYAGQLSGLMNVGGVGLDVGGASSILAKVDAALRGGGGAGEASQFFSAAIGARNGLDPFELQMWREGGASATKSDMLGKNSRAASFGFDIHEGDETWLTASTKFLREQYGDNPGMLAHATARHFGGISMNQAIAMQQIQTPQMGTIEGLLKESGFELKDLNASAISGIGQAASGTAEQRMALARDLYGRTGKNALSDPNRDILNSVMQGGNAEEQTRELVRLLANYGQEDTDGKAIRDTKVGIDNLNTSLAERLIPLTQGIRDAVMFMAGNDGEYSPMDIQKKLIEQDFEQESGLIGSQYDAGISGGRNKLRVLETGLLDQDLELNRKVMIGDLTQEQADQQSAKNHSEVAAIRTKLKADEKAKAERMSVARAERDRRLAELSPGTISSGGSAGTPEGWIGTSAEDSKLPAYRAGMDPSYGLGGAGVPGGARALGERQNNPGNLERGIPWQGAIGTSGRFETFDSIESGMRAFGKNLSTYHKRDKIDTINGVINKWAPSSDGNDVSAYARRVAKHMGVGVNDTIDLNDQATLASLMQGMTIVEQGRDMYGGDQYMKGAGAALGYGPQMPASAQQAAQQGGNISVEPLQVNVSVSGHGTASAPQQLQTRLGPAPSHR